MAVLTAPMDINEEQCPDCRHTLGSHGMGGCELDHCNPICTLSQSFLREYFEAV